MLQLINPPIVKLVDTTDLKSCRLGSASSSMPEDTTR